jgi:uncharacterized protein YjbJ (UPF0337 family)
MTNKAQELKGRAKEAGEKGTGDKDLEAKGKADQLKAHSREAGADVKKTARKVSNTLSR